MNFNLLGFHAEKRRVFSRKRGNLPLQANRVCWHISEELVHNTWRGRPWRWSRIKWASHKAQRFSASQDMVHMEIPAHPRQIPIAVSLFPHFHILLKYKQDVRAHSAMVGAISSAMVTWECGGTKRERWLPHPVVTRVEKEKKSSYPCWQMLLMGLWAIRGGFTFTHNLEFLSIFSQCKAAVHFVHPTLCAFSSCLIIQEAGGPFFWL